MKKTIKHKKPSFNKAAQKSRKKHLQDEAVRNRMPPSATERWKQITRDSKDKDTDIDRMSGPFRQPEGWNWRE